MGDITNPEYIVHHPTGEDAHSLAAIPVGDEPRHRCVSIRDEATASLISMFRQASNVNEDHADRTLPRAATSMQDFNSHDKAAPIAAVNSLWRPRPASAAGWPLNKGLPT